MLSIWLKRQCLEGYFHGKVKNNALSIKNGRATPKRYAIRVKSYNPLLQMVARIFYYIQADRGCAAGDVFVGGEGAFGQKGL